MPNGKDFDHYCIQAKRIEAMDKKLDTLTGHFRVDGIVGKMSGSIEKMALFVEERQDGKKKENGTLPVKWLIFAVIGLIVILAGLLGIKLPF